jgi:hypothetical protein
MMQVTRAAFQAKAILNQQATDWKSHTSVRTFYYEVLFLHLGAGRQKPRCWALGFGKARRSFARFFE